MKKKENSRGSRGEKDTGIILKEKQELKENLKMEIDK